MSQAHRIARWASSLSLVVLASCAPAPRTQVMVRVVAEGSVAAEAMQLEVRVFRDGDLATEPFVDRLGSTLTPVTFPLDIALVPERNDPARRYRVEVRALSSSGAEVASARVLSGFVARRTLLLRLPLEACCRDVVCDETEACRACVCAPIDVDAAALDDFVPETGAPDATIGPVDASLPDAFVPSDAPVCVENCFIVDGFTGGLNIAPPLIDRRWARPLGGCPAGSVSPSDQHGVRGIYLHNPSGAARAVRLRSLREPPEDPGVDLALVVYDVPSPMAMTPLPTDPRACRAMNEDDPTIAPDAQLDVTIAPGATILVLVTRETADQIVSPNVNIGVSPL